MKDVHVRPATKEDFEDIADVLVSQNSRPELRCIQSDTDEGHQATWDEMVRLDSKSELMFAIAKFRGQVLGVLGCETDKTSGRGWLRGPFVLATHCDWSNVASMLFQDLSSRLPSAIKRLDAFLDVANQQGNQFYLAQGFRRVGLVHEYIADAPASVVHVPAPCPMLTSDLEASCIALHDTTFPGRYLSGKQIVSKSDNDNSVFVYAENGELLGYLFATIEEGIAYGTIEFVGVKADSRGKGVGRRLIMTALKWFFETKGKSQVGLTVNDDLANARSLYESVGFRLLYTGVHTRRDL